MKKILLSLTLILGISAAVTSQSYSVSKSSGTYVDLASPISLTNNLTWDDPLATIPLGFNFTFFDSTVNTLYFNDFFLGGTITTSDQFTGKTGLISVFEADLMDRGYDFLAGDDAPGGLSDISYKTEGLAGSKICKIQWKNAGFYADIDDLNQSNSFANCQIWLYEGSNNVEFHYGESKIDDAPLVYEGSTGATIGLWPTLNFDTYLIEGDGVAVHGTIPSETGFISYADTFPMVDGTPTNGTIYKFSFDATSIKKHNELENKISIWPKPASNLINITTSLDLQNTATLFDINGKASIVNIVNNTIEIANLPAGVYTLQLTTNQQIVSKKFIKL